MFLIEKLPKESDNTVNEPTSKIALLEKSLAATISQDFKSSWTNPSQEPERFTGRTKTPFRTVPIDVPSEEKGEGINFCRKNVLKNIFINYCLL